MRFLGRLVLFVRLLWLGYSADDAEAELELLDREERKAQLRVVEGGG